MCGIVGIYNYKKQEPVNEKILIEMRDTMVHRGPDGAGIWISPDKRVGFAHRRLSIIDLSASANQPMCNEDESIWIVFNGEIYNHFEIRPELEKLGHRFKTDHSDTEVVIHSFEEWGVSCVHRFRGMFAFALWDEKKKELWLFRDRIGVKPLYYTYQNDQLIFASEIKAILAYPDIKREVNEEAFYHYLSFLTTPSPYTLFEKIMKLPPGCYVKIQKNGNIKVNRYWELWDYTKPLINVSEEEIAIRLLEELKIAVRYRKVSDVPVGIFLSGGIDSSTNAVLFSEDEKNSIKTFSIGYDKEYQSYHNEFQYARKIAKQVKSNHYERQLKIDDLIKFLPELTYYQDEPIADPVCIPVYYLSKLARDNGVIVCQVGEGSDELFCGYPGWKSSLNLQKYNKLPLGIPIKRLGLSLLKIIGREQRMYYEWLRRAVEKQPIFWGGAEAFTETQKKILISSRLRKKFRGYSSYEALKPIEKRFKEKAWEKSNLNWMSYLDLNLRLPELLLMRVDKMSMATSLEARVPFLDHKFVELAMSIPESVKTRNGELKYILKKAVRGIIPDEILNRKKQGFGVPIYEWFFDKLGDYTNNKIHNFIQRTDFFDKSYVEELFRTNNGSKLWYILNFVLWHERWIENKNE
jgi:asparagine synthase (glutamine-hydrolysing)